MKQNGFDSMRINLFSFTNLFNTTETCERLIFKFSLIKATVVCSNSLLLQHAKIYANIFFYHTTPPLFLNYYTIICYNIYTYETRFDLYTYLQTNTPYDNGFKVASRNIK